MAISKSITVASVGGFGHSVFVFDEMMPRADAMRLVAMAPAYAGETLEAFSEHPVVQRDKPQIFDSVETLLKNAKPEVVVVSTQPGRIAEHVIAALRAGSHVIAEKPLACTISELDRVHSEWHRSRQGLFVMLSMRGSPAFGAARKVCLEGLLGEVVAANARKSYKWGNQRPEWFSDRQKYGGTFPWIGIHALDMIHFISGQRFTEVSAMQTNLGHPDRPGCEDVCVGIFRLENGALATVSVDYFRPAAASTHGDDWCRIVGTRGIVEANASQGWCRLQTVGDSLPHELPLERPATLFADFFEALRTSKRTDEATRTSFHLTEACLAAREAAETGKRGTIDSRRWDFNS